MLQFLCGKKIFVSLGAFVYLIEVLSTVGID
jgi:hypothetical protein